MLTVFSSGTISIVKNEWARTNQTEFYSLLDHDSNCSFMCLGVLKLAIIMNDQNVLIKNLLGGQCINSGKSFRNLFSDEEVTHRGKMSFRLVEPFNIFLEEELYHLGR